MIQLHGGKSPYPYCPASSLTVSLTAPCGSSLLYRLRRPSPRPSISTSPFPLQQTINQRTSPKSCNKNNNKKDEITTSTDRIGMYTAATPTERAPFSPSCPSSPCPLQPVIPPPPPPKTAPRQNRCGPIRNSTLRGRSPVERPSQNRNQRWSSLAWEQRGGRGKRRLSELLAAGVDFVARRRRKKPSMLSGMRRRRRRRKKGKETQKRKRPGEIVWMSSRSRAGWAVRKKTRRTRRRPNLLLILFYWLRWALGLRDECCS